MKRVCLLVMDSFGIGSAPDAACFGGDGFSDEGANTLGHIAETLALTGAPLLPKSSVRPPSFRSGRARVAQPVIRHKFRVIVRLPTYFGVMRHNSA